MMDNKQTALDTLVREELGIDPDDLGGSAWTAAGTSFALFSVVAVFPLLGFIALDVEPAALSGIVARALAVFPLVGGPHLFTSLGLLFSVPSQLATGPGRPDDPHALRSQK